MALTLGLTPAQLADRKKGIGGSDAARIVSGDWYALWAEKTSRAAPEDLSRNLAVQLGLYTEAFNAHWYEMLNPDIHIGNRGQAVVHEEYPFLRCTLDGIAFSRSVNATLGVWQAKHVNAFSKMEEVVARYTPQVMHEMIVTGFHRAILSVIIGTDKYEAVEIERDEFFASAYIDRCIKFWRHVETDTPPVEGAPLPVPEPPAKYRTVSMQGNNAWAMHAGDWLANATAAKLFDASAKALKGMIEADVGEASGHGVMVKRDKRGLSIKETAK